MSDDALDAFSKYNTEMRGAVGRLSVTGAVTENLHRVQALASADSPWKEAQDQHLETFNSAKRGMHRSHNYSQTQRPPPPSAPAPLEGKTSSRLNRLRVGGRKDKETPSFLFHALKLDAKGI